MNNLEKSKMLERICEELRTNFDISNYAFGTSPLRESYLMMLGYAEIIKGKKDSLIEFLDNNPATETAPPKQSYTKEQEIEWLADLEAHKRIEEAEFSLHL